MPADACEEQSLVEIDPVCRMAVVPGRAFAAAAHRDDTHQACAEAFRDDPERCLSGGVRRAVGTGATIRHAMGRFVIASTTGHAGLASVAGWPTRRWLVAVMAASVAALLMGIPTGIVPTSFYTRMTPVVWWDYPVWALSAALVGLIAATYVRAPDIAAATIPDRSKRSVGAMVLSTFAVGCPICNKLVVALIGASGALSYFQPIQPVLGAAGLALLVAGLMVRIRGETACRVPGT